LQAGTEPRTARPSCLPSRVGAPSVSILARACRTKALHRPPLRPWRTASRLSARASATQEPWAYSSASAVTIATTSLALWPPATLPSRPSKKRLSLGPTPSVSRSTGRRTSAVRPSSLPPTPPTQQQGPMRLPHRHHASNGCLREATAAPFRSSQATAVLRWPPSAASLAPTL
jgi:hypothetical protein